MNNTADNEKLDWMYKGATSQVDREEYLLGKSVDKSFEQLKNEEKEKKLGLVPPKNHVEHECIPPSIRDYNKIVQQEQVDLSAKLQEDPLVAIKKQEEEARRQFLQNPIQLKKLQEALKAQDSKKKNKKKKHKRNKHSDSEGELDKKLSEKLRNLKSSSVATNILKKDKKKNKDNDLDTILMHKYNQLKDKLSQKDLDNILAGKSSSESDQESPKSKKQKRRSSSNSSENSYDSDIVKGNVKKVDYTRNKPSSSKYKNNKEKSDYSKEYRRRRDTSTSSSNSEYSDKKNKYVSRNEKKYASKESRSRDSTKEYVDRRSDNDPRSRKHRSNSSTRSHSRSNEKRKILNKEEIQADSNKLDQDLDKLILGKLRMLRDSKTDKTEVIEVKTDGLKEYSHYDSDNDEYVVKKKAFGLVRSDGTKIPLKNSISEPRKTEKKNQPTKVDIKKTKKLSDKEKEELRKQMMTDAVKRDQERSVNLKKHREENQKEERKIEEFDKNFVHRELSKSQSNIKDVESRIRSKLNNIQRSSQHMNSNFSKRS